MTAAAALYFAVPSVRSLAVAAVGLGSVWAVLVGLRRYRPKRVWPWGMLATALGVSAVARLVYDALPGQAGLLKPWSWTVWAMHLVAAVLLIGGVVGMAKATIRGLPGAIDAAIIAIGTGLIAIILVAIPYARLSGTGVLYGSVRIAYVVRDVLILGAALLLITAVRRSWSVFLIFAGLMGLLAYDLIFRVGRIRGTYLSGTAIDIGWLLFFAAIGAAALVPSMVATDVPRRLGPEITPLRLVPVALAALLPTVLLIIQRFRLPTWSEPMVIAVVAVVLILVFARLVDLAHRLRRQVRGERALREAIADLADVQDVDAVGPILDRAVRELLEPHSSYRLALAPRELLQPDHEAVEEGEPGPTASLPAATARLVGDGGFTMAIPLTRPRRSRSGQSAPDATVDQTDPASQLSQPTLLVRADRASLLAIRPRLDVLATEAAVALERIQLQDEVIRHSSETYFRTLVQNSTDVILIVDGDGRIRYASPSADAFFGPTSLLGVALSTLVRQDEDASVERLFEQARQVAGTTQRPTVSPDGDWTIRRPDRDPARVEVSCLDLRHDPSVHGLVVTLHDVTEQRHLQRELVDRASQDSLTGISNRLGFSDRLGEVVGSSTAADGLVAAFFVDLDDMKVINDGLGHVVGDTLLKRTGERLSRFVAEKATTRPGMAARLGGDEFAVLLTDLIDNEAADVAAAELAARLSRPVQLNGHEVTCTASVGVATTADVSSSADLLRHADLALYAAKAAGKGRSCQYQPWMRHAVMERLELRSALARAIANDELFLEYQPIVALEDGRLVGFEALLRWAHPLRGRLAPDAFISVAEESGLIVPIGDWVLTTAANAIKVITAGEGDLEPYVAVNVSARQFREADFVSTVHRVLESTGLPPQRLLIEITESVLLRDDESTWSDLGRLRDLGVRVAIDDFGTGYSALSYLRQVPLDIVKLDRTFTQHMTVSDQQRELVEGIVRLTRILGLQVVAEGIETDQELAVARQVCCDYGQGFLFGKPMPAEAAKLWMAARKPRSANQQSTPPFPTELFSKSGLNGRPSAR